MPGEPSLVLEFEARTSRRKPWPVSDRGGEVRGGGVEPAQEEGGGGGRGVCNTLTVRFLVRDGPVPVGVARGQRRVRRGVVHLQTEDADGSAIAVRGSASHPDPHTDHGGWATRSAADRREGPAQVVADDTTLGLRAPRGPRPTPSKMHCALRCRGPWARTFVSVKMRMSASSAST